MLVFYNDAAALLLGKPFAELGEIPSGEFGASLQLSTPDGELLLRRDTPSGVAFFEQRPSHQTVMATSYDGVRRAYEATAYPLLGATGRDARRARGVLGGQASGTTRGGRGLMRARVWGCRGSVAAPGPDTVKYGGNTSCVEVRLESGHAIVLDAGTGMRPLGVAMQRRPAGRAARDAHPSAHGSSAGPRVLPPVVRARPRHPHLGPDVAGAAPGRTHRDVPLAAAVPRAARRRAVAAHVPRRARGAGDDRIGDGPRRQR